MVRPLLRVPYYGNAVIGQGLIIESLEVIDPYCAAGEESREKLQDFIRKFIKDVGVAEKVTIICKEQREENHFHTPRLTEVRLTQLRIIDPVVKVLRDSKWTFHDREIKINIADQQSGETSNFQYILTGGIDYLMNPKAITKVIVRKLNN